MSTSATYAYGGVVRFRMGDTWLDTNAQTVIGAGEIVGEIVNGRLAVDLPAGFTYTVTECIPGGRSYEIAVPAGAVGQLELGELAPPAPATSSPSGGSVTSPSYVHHQIEAATLWTIAHNLNTLGVTVVPYDAQGQEFSAVITVVNANVVTLSLTPARSGFAVVTS